VSDADSDIEDSAYNLSVWHRGEIFLVATKLASLWFTPTIKL